MDDTGKVITVFGAQGGTGKTVIAINIALALAQPGTVRRVALVDLDVRFGDIGIFMGVPSERSIADLAAAGEITEQAVRECTYRHGSGVTILQSQVRPRDWTNVRASHIKDIVTHLALSHDYVILDSPKTFELLMAALALADDALLVTPHHETALDATDRMIDWLAYWNVAKPRIGLVLTDLNGKDPVDLGHVERKLGAGVLCFVPYDRNIGATMSLGLPPVGILPDSAAERSLKMLAIDLMRPLFRHDPEILIACGALDIDRLYPRSPFRRAKVGT